MYPGETITIGLTAYDLNGNPTYAQILTRMTKLRKHWRVGKNHNYTYTSSDDITYLLPVAQQIQTVYSNSCASLCFTIFSQSIMDIMFLSFEVLRYIPKLKLNLF